MIQQIAHNSKLLSIIIRRNFEKNGIEFFTPDDFSQQLAYMKRPKDYAIPPHVHNAVVREVQFTKEVLFIKSGKVRVDFYDERLDKSFYATLSAINLRLQRNKNIQIPNTSTVITSSEKHSEKVKNLSEKLKSFFDGGFKLYGEEDKQRALKVWKAFFNDRYFEELIK